MEKEINETKEKIFLKRELSVWFFRHGEWDYKTDSLNEKGRQQAKDTAKNLFELVGEGEIVKFYSSPMGRTKETTKIMQETFGELRTLETKTRIRKELKDAGFDSNYVKTARELGIPSDELLGYWYKVDDPRGVVETPQKVKMRLTEFLLRLGKIVSRLPEGPKVNLVLVSHGEVVGPYLKEAFKKHGLPPCGWARFDFEKGLVEKIKLTTWDKKNTELNL